MQLGYAQQVRAGSSACRVRGAAARRHARGSTRARPTGRDREHGVRSSGERDAARALLTDEAVEDELAQTAIVAVVLVVHGQLIAAWRRDLARRRPP